MASLAFRTCAVPVPARSGSRIGRPASRGVVAVRAEADGPPSPAKLAVAAPAGALVASAVAVAVVDPSPLVSFINAAGVPVIGAVIDAVGPPDALIRWFHGVNMAIVLGAMGGYGSYLGYKIRAGKGGEPTTLPAFDAARLHPLLMGGMTFFFTAGALGGITFETVEGREILGSPHAVTAFAGLLLLAGQGLLGVTMGPSKERRALHAALGTSIMALFVVHAGLGYYLGTH